VTAGDDAHVVRESRVRGKHRQRVRAVVLNYNGGELTVECLRRLRETDWPDDSFEIVLVDNASSDDVVATVRQDWPEVRIIESDRNLGFGGGNNLALRDLDVVDAVALVNSDVLVEPGWLAPLVRTLSQNSTVGAACPKILFASQFREVELRSGTHRRGRGDRRRLGVQVSGARASDENLWRDTQLVEGFWGPEYGAEPGSGFQWTSGRAVVRVPTATSSLTDRCQLRLAADVPTRVYARSGRCEAELHVGTEPSWHTVPLVGRPFDVINNVGIVPAGDGYFADRGYLERDHGQYAAPEPVVAWSGGAVLLAAPYLADVGRFDAELFLYYEDVDLSWRGRQRGWQYRYTPESVVRHVHSASTMEGSRQFDYYNERNRLLTLTRYADRATVAKALARYVLVTGSYAQRDIVAPLLRGRMPRLEVPVRRLRALGGFAAAVGPRILPTLGRQRTGA
jgi:GT2 family glycosyltransferase